jgi:histidinol dehydrogenase
MNSTPIQLARIDTRTPQAAAQLAALREKLSPQGNVVSAAGRQRTQAVFGQPLSPQQVVERICADVRERGLAAVLEYGEKLDRASLTAETLRVPAAKLAAAHAAAEPTFLETIRRIRANVKNFQTAILHQDVTIPAPGGGTLTQRYVPLKRLGICVPGGAAAYPSTVLMTAVPAQAAGVQELAVVAPPTPFGAYNRDLLATCHELGITEVYRMGGAQAVAAMAYGVEGVPRVDKIVGPGNLFVALAKKHVFGEVDIDSIAGPSEVIVLADDSARADFVAAEMIAQAEHSPGSSLLITWSEHLIEEVAVEIDKQLASLERGDLARQSLEDFGALVYVADAAAGVALTNLLAPEHLHIATANPREQLKEITCAGASFLGPYTPVALGDYVAGPSHVLPTGGTARFASGLCSNDFLRAGSVIEFDAAGLAHVAPDVAAMAAKEGLTAHWNSVNIRLSK